MISCPYPIGGPLSLGPSGTISIVLRSFGGRAIDAPATAQRVVLVLGAIVDTLNGLGLSWSGRDTRRDCSCDVEFRDRAMLKLRKGSTEHRRQENGHQRCHEKGQAAAKRLTDS